MGETVYTEPVFSVRTAYDKEAYMAYAKYSFKVKSRILDWFTQIGGILLIGMSVLYYVQGDRSIRDAVMGVLLGIVLLFAFKFISLKMASVMLKRDKMNGDNVAEYQFFDDRVEIEDKLAKGTIYYNQFVKLGEMDQYFYLFINDQLGYIINKNGFYKGYPDHFEAFIKQKMKK